MLKSTSVGKHKTKEKHLRLKKLCKYFLKIVYNTIIIIIILLTHAILAVLSSQDWYLQFILCSVGGSTTDFSQY